MLSSSSDTRETLRHLFLFTNTAQRELVSICRQRIRNSNQLPLHYYLTLASVVLQSVYFPNYIYLQGPYRKYIVSKDYKRIRNCYFLYLLLIDSTLRSCMFFLFEGPGLRTFQFLFLGLFLFTTPKLRRYLYSQLVNLVSTRFKDFTRLRGSGVISFALMIDWTNVHSY